MDKKKWYLEKIKNLKNELKNPDNKNLRHEIMRSIHYCERKLESIK